MQYTQCLKISVLGHWEERKACKTAYLNPDTSISTTFECHAIVEADIKLIEFLFPKLCIYFVPVNSMPAYPQLQRT